jgi:hypothetical protein
VASSRCSSDQRGAQEALLQNHGDFNRGGDGSNLWRAADRDTDQQEQSVPVSMVAIRRAARAGTDPIQLVSHKVGEETSDKHPEASINTQDRIQWRFDLDGAASKKGMGQMQAPHGSGPVDWV